MEEIEEEDEGEDARQVHGFQNSVMVTEEKWKSLLDPCVSMEVVGTSMAPNCPRSLKKTE